MSGPETSNSPQVKLMLSLIEGLRTRDMEVVANLLHKDLRRVTYPRSLGRPEYNKEEWLVQAAGLLGLFAEDGQVTHHSIIEAPGTIIAHFTGEVKTSLGVDMTRENILIAYIVTDEDGSLKIKQLDEFTDSKAYIDFFKAVAEAEAIREHSASYAA